MASTDLHDRHVSLSCDLACQLGNPLDLTFPKCDMDHRISCPG